MKNRLLMFIFAICAMSQISFSQMAPSQAIQASLDSIVTVYTVVDGKEIAAGSGIVVGSGGFILTPLSLVKDAASISVKLRNGEIYDNAKIVNKDERRNVVLLQIIAGVLKPIPNKSLAESMIGSEISVISNASGGTSATKNGTLSGMQLADGITGAGTGYRLIVFETRATDNLAGGLLLDDKGNSIGIVTTTSNVKQANIAVPFSSISGLFSTANAETVGPAMTTTGMQTPSNTRTTGMTDEAANPNWTKAHKVLHTAQTIFVHSKTSYIQTNAFIAELMKNPDFTEWGWSFSNSRETADLVLEVERLPWVIKFTFKLYSIKHGVIIASGNVHTNDFNYGSPDMVREVIRRIKLELAMSK